MPKAKRVEVELVCEHCKKEYLVPHWRESQSRFCSQRCDILSRQNPNATLPNLKFVELESGTQKCRWTRQYQRAKRSFYNHRLSAKHRGIKFLLTFEQWWIIWQDSGYWKERGRLKGQYVMARKGDKGPYAIGNVKIIKVEENIEERVTPRGSATTVSKITEDDVRKIRSLDGKMKRPLVAKMFGLNIWHVRDIQKRRAWKWLE